MSKISSKFLLSFSQKRFLDTLATASSSTLPSSSLFAIEFLKTSCGLSSKSAHSTNQKLQLNEKDSQKYESVISFLKAYEFDNAQIAKLIKKRPSILNCRVDTNLKPKLDFLVEIGFVGPLLPKVILSNSSIVTRGLDSRLKPSFSFVKELLGSNENVISAVSRSSWLLTANYKCNLRANIDVLLGEGVPSSSISKFIMLQARSFMRRVDRMVFAVKKAKELGFKPTAPMFVHAVRVMISMNDSNWQKKIDILKSLGWSEKEILRAFKRDPFCLACSEEKMRNVVDFCFNTAKLDPETVIAYPKLFMCGLDKTTRPRYNVLKVLMLKNLIEEGRKIAWVLVQGEKRFLKNYVLKHLDEVPDLMDIYRGKKAAETIPVLSGAKL